MLSGGGLCPATLGGRADMVRHADAIAKSAWPGLDADRPLGTLGDRQSVHLFAARADDETSALHSSPTLRCRQTLQSLPVARRIPIVDDPLLAADATVGEVLAALDRSDYGTLWCTHRECSSSWQGSPPNRDPRLLPTGKAAKAGVWIVHRDRETCYIAADSPALTEYPISGTTGDRVRSRPCSGGRWPVKRSPPLAEAGGGLLARPRWAGGVIHGNYPAIGVDGRFTAGDPTTIRDPADQPAR
ncbi:hypothetical protein EEB14_56235 [Rhodococcus sp. WS4]|nr:hypothetical protein EEB14_56235 [Rhodococcus sp. WS4]